ncbi:cytochrome b/b6 domain-containing protein [Rudaea sp.]|uniref:cytochrome b/b6 domain-containing protein n=1 Tax=Rudaea sp. TaxID=2136325 RepID=UPI002ED3B001
MSKTKVEVWDKPVRIMHWLLVLAVASAWFTRGRLDSWHEWLGYAALVIVALRIVWGFIGSRHARFAQFVRAPRASLRYLREIATGRAPRHLGHNPLGGWMILALLSCVSALGLTGWLATTDWLWGYAWLAELHAGLGWTFVTLVCLHLAGVLFSSWQHRENLVAAMLSGRKAAPLDGDVR